MAQQMITLEEAAAKLNLSPEEMRKRLKTDPEFKRLSQIRDGSTVRFKLSAIEELARELGMSSEDNLPLAPLANDEIGSSEFEVPVVDTKKKSDANKKSDGKKSDAKKKSDADVPLDFGSSDDDDVFSLADDSKSASPKSSAKLVPNKPGKGMSDSSSGSTDSDVRLDGGKSKKPRTDETVPTEEIALDFSGPGSAVIKGGSSAKLSAPKTGAGSGKLTSPERTKSKAELDLDKAASKSDLDLDKAKKSDVKKKSDANKKSDAKKSSARGLPSGPPADSSEFELSLDADSDDFELQMSNSGDDEVDLGSLPKTGVARGSKSGINLRDPADSGISLEKGKTSKDSGKDSKKSSGKSKGDTEKGMSDSSDARSEEPPSSDVDFELSLDASAAASTSKLGAPKSGKLVLDSESDSEFELTLDDSSSSSLEQAALGSDAGGDDSADKGDIFETDFEIPPMPDESGSEAVAVDPDSDLDKADFELAMDDSDVAAEEQSGSEVVLLEEEEEGAPKAKKSAKSKSKASIAEVDLDEAGLEAVDEEVDEESAAGALKGVKGRARGDEDEDDEEAPAGAVVERPTKPWGVLPALFLAPTFFLVLVGALMGYEMLQTMWGYQQPRRPTAPIVRGLATNLDMPLNDQ